MSLRGSARRGRGRGGTAVAAAAVRPKHGGAPMRSPSGARGSSTSVLDGMDPMEMLADAVAMAGDEVAGDPLLAMLAEKMGELQGELAALKAERSHLERTRLDYEKQMAGVRLAKEEVEATQIYAKAELETARAAEAKRLRAEQRQLETRERNLRAHRDSKGPAVSALQSEVDSLKSTLKSTKLRHKTEVDRLKSRTEDLAKQNAELTSQVEHLQSAALATQRAAEPKRAPRRPVSGGPRATGPVRVAKATDAAAPLPSRGGAKDAAVARRGGPGSAAGRSGRPLGGPTPGSPDAQEYQAGARPEGSTRPGASPLLRPVDAAVVSRRELPNGAVETEYEDGRSVSRFPNSDERHSFADGHVIYFYAHADPLRAAIETPDGAEILHFADGSTQTTSPDGHVEYQLPSGAVVVQESSVPDDFR
jgi:hypothetical protein